MNLTLALGLLTLCLQATGSTTSFGSTNASRCYEESNSPFTDYGVMAKIYVNRGNVFHQIHEYEKALADYDKALEIGNVALDIVHYNRALTLIRQKEWDLAKAALETALEINPNSSRAKRKLDQFNAPVEQPRAEVVDPEGALN
jgi:tetratricopeptide (TPR) repeat protein